MREHFEPRSKKVAHSRSRCCLARQAETPTAATYLENNWGRPAAPPPAHVPLVTPLSQLRKTADWSHRGRQYVAGRPRVPAATAILDFAGTLAVSARGRASRFLGALCTGHTSFINVREEASRVCARVTTHSESPVRPAQVRTRDRRTRAKTRWCCPGGRPPCTTAPPSRTRWRRASRTARTRSARATGCKSRRAPALAVRL